MPKGKTHVHIAREGGRVRLTIETDADRWEEAYSHVLNPGALKSARKAAEALAELEEKLNIAVQDEDAAPDSDS